jgi:hypothetical protein
MQANRRKTTWFNMQKLVVNNYALGILVLKVTITPQDLGGILRWRFFLNFSRLLQDFRKI